MKKDSDLLKVILFLNEIGLVATQVLETNGWTSNIEIKAGELLVGGNCPASELLHEAGHLAIVPNEYRHLMNGDVEVGVREMFETFEKNGLTPVDDSFRRLLQVDESSATAWAWAAGKAIGLDDEKTIRNKDYSGQGSIERLRLSSNMHYGINGLSHAGFCKVRESHPGDLPVYPKLSYWLQK